jgi:hypothetical protein
MIFRFYQKTWLPSSNQRGQKGINSQPIFDGLFDVHTSIAFEECRSPPSSAILTDLENRALQFEAIE